MFPGTRNQSFILLNCLGREGRLNSMDTGHPMPASLRARTALGTLTGGPQSVLLAPHLQAEAQEVIHLVWSLRREVVPALSV